MPPPLGLHWAAWTFWVRRRGIWSWVLLRSCLDGTQPRPARARARCPRGQSCAGSSFDSGPKTPASCGHRLPVVIPQRGGRMTLRSTRVAGTATAALAIALAAPAAALADGSTLSLANKGDLTQAVGINSIWVLVAGILVMFMQAGFAFLEIGFSRGKNAGTVIAKILVNFSIAALMFYAVGFAFSFGDGNQIIGTHGFFLAGPHAGANFPLAYSGPKSTGHVTVETLWFFQFVFCAVSLAIVWGTTLERIKFGVYIIYAMVFSALIYPIGAHWIFGGGWLATKFGMQD